MVEVLTQCGPAGDPGTRCQVQNLHLRAGSWAEGELRLVGIEHQASNACSRQQVVSEVSPAEKVVHLKGLGDAQHC